MHGYWWIMLAVALLGFTAVAVMWRPVLLSWRENRLAEARRDFHWQRERLEAKFLNLGMMPNRPQDARWNDCWFDDDVAYARSRTSGELSAFVAVRIRLETPADPMLVDSALGDPCCDATAVFRFDGRRWDTEGRAIFNLTPTEAIHFFERDLEMIGQEQAQRSKV
ncbi:MAG: hypothetical protein ACOX1P_20580 [Thermoguttaceae bacterium]|jgi:hypothetical protein